MCAPVEAGSRVRHLSYPGPLLSPLPARVVSCSRIRSVPMALTALRSGGVFVAAIGLVCVSLLLGRCLAGDPVVYFDWDVSYISVAPLGVKQEVPPSLIRKSLYDSSPF